RLLCVGQPYLQYRHLGGSGAQARFEQPVIGECGHALIVKIEKRRGNTDIQDRNHHDQHRQREETTGSAGRQVSNGGYGANSAVIVNTSDWLAAMRVTGAAKVGLRSSSPAERFGINLEAAADRPVSVTLRCCCTKSVRYVSAGSSRVNAARMASGRPSLARSVSIKSALMDSLLISCSSRCASDAAMRSTAISRSS